MKQGQRFQKDCRMLELLSMGAALLILVLAVLFLSGLLQQTSMLYSVLFLGVLLHFLLGAVNLLKGKKILARCMLCLCVAYIGVLIYLVVSFLEMEQI